MNQTSDRHTAKVIGVSIAAAVGGFLFGFDSSVINGAVDSIEDHFLLGSFTTGFVVAIALIGCAVGAWFAGSLADRWGRKKVMLLGSALFVISSIGSGLAFSVPDLMLWRVLGGLGIGIASVIAPAYIAEIAPAKWRGSLASLQQLAITIGIFAALLSDALLAGAADGASNDLWFGIEAWRWMFLVGVVPALVYGLLATLIPESPRYLVGQHLDEEAARVLAEITGELHPDERIHEIRLTLRKESRSSFADIRGPKFGLQPIVWVGITMAVLQQLVGINAIFYYSTTLWRSVGFTEDQSFTTSVITAVINVVMTFVAILFVDRIGRRKLLMGGSIGMFAGLVMASVAFSQATGSGDDVTLPAPWGAIALVGANLFVIFFASTWGPIMWVMLGEMFPNRMRAMALGIGTAANWMANFAVTLAFPPLTSSVGLWVIYAGFALFAALSFFFVKAKIRETKGMELEDMLG
ncbi:MULTISPECIES: sugar porter family MFS transporter [unclassified Rhodococcus (in: high G+C Gram-positive bacteria)]|uniref:sugar porter family MFS transporter n=1 Tax=unclassified Rhodococcus (in: high G+C Gram-positive bacteria) TaxID=192944 RepID=UPI000B9C0E84|nr:MULTISPECIES: sugar porter family MFS transporter [unclassified Rhodococcus (in: high G+C Gram-positive bacteria)]MDV7991816.1 sugar porter family MFS transporter [Rhodococcus sp. IEGM 1374]MDV8078415.1 sugar porter family MFS transporter [Rhodococcus sp. IEGM 1370]OZE35056.1 MFS transporter [Rhodococcus sp. 05-2254-6]OZE41529.1 MFS transporter [Rhodococcus sp. 05-2254-4]OZE43250.1 MFS transporter [Rhodococcus sp. 05-2254-3]